MNRLHLPRADQVVLSALAAASTYFTLLAWNGLAEHASTFLVPLFWICAGTAAVGLALRTLGAPLVVVPLVQALLAALFLHHLWAADPALFGWLPTPTSLSEALSVLQNGGRQAALWPAPVPPAAGDFPALMLATGTVVALLVDLLACTLRRVPAAGLPLLAAFTVPVSLLGGVSWVTFAFASLSFTMLLTADQAARLGRWGHTLAPSSREDVIDNQPHQVRLGTLWPTASRFAVAGVAIAVIAPVLLPQGLDLFDGNGPGDGTGEGDELALSNPMVDIQRDLSRGEDRPLVTVDTDDPNPGYLRLAVLDKFDGTVWEASERDLPPSQKAEGELPVAPGLSPDTPRTSYLSDVEVSAGFQTSWLPAPYPASRVNVPGDWRYGLNTLDLLSADTGVTAAGLAYEVESQEVRPDPAALVAAPPAPRSVFAPNTELPSTLPPWVVNLAKSVTARGRSQFEKAVILQRWFRVDGGFEYSLDTASGSSLDQLEQFLRFDGDGSREGYCEQFSSAMAMMARSLGIPARVAVGFLRPERDGDGTWVYSSHDLHAWPELYFEGTGWVRFEPTPQDQALDVPAYTTGRVPRLGDDPTGDPSASGLESIRPSVSADRGATSESADSGSGPETNWLMLPVGLAALLTLLSLPRLLRVRVRRQRLGTSGVGAGGRSPREVAEGAWAEVRATALDLGLGWDDGATLRRRARVLAASLAGERGAQPARLALEDLVLLMERARYSRDGLTAEQEGDVRAATEDILASLREKATPSARRRATWLPVSLWQSGRMHGTARSASASGGASGRSGEDLDRLSV